MYRTLGRKPLGTRAKKTAIGLAVSLALAGSVLAASPSSAQADSAADSSGALWAWGWNGDGQLGDGTKTARSAPVRVKNLAAVTQVSSDGYSSLALGTDGTVWAWGWNGDGQLGDGTKTARSAPVRVKNLSGVVQVQTYGATSFAVKSNGTLWAWGFNGIGQLGDGTKTNRSTPVQVKGLTGVEQVFTDGNSSFALKTDGTVWAWGYNAYGKLGDGTTVDRTKPVPVVGLSEVKQLVTGWGASFAVKSNGTLWAWGYNDFGQLGDGTKTDRSTPVQINGLDGVTQLYADGISIIALKADGTVWAWGDNSHGQLGDGTTVSRLEPVQVNGLSGVKQLHSVGVNPYDDEPAEHGISSFAVKDDRTVWAWGDNGFGQLGDGTTSGRLAPVQVKNLAEVTQVYAGGLSSFAIKADGTLWAWGYNGISQLGDGTDVDRSTPVKVKNLSGVKQVLSDGFSALAITEIPLKTFSKSYAPTVSDTTPQVGQKLTANVKAWSPKPSFAYQWFAGGEAITGATGSSYTVTFGDLGKQLKVSIKATKAGYEQKVLESAATTAVTPGTLSAKTPTISGTAKTDSVLTVKVAAWGPSQVELDREWLRDGQPIPGATGITYKVTAADAGKKIAVKVTGEKEGYTTVSKTSSAKKAAKASLTSYAPSITGTVKVGNQVSVSVKDWKASSAAIDPSVSLEYQWYRNGKAITQDGDGRDYMLVDADSGKQITVKVTGAKDGYTTVSKTSKAKKAAAGTFSVAPEKPVVTGTVAVGQTLTVAAGNWSANPTLSYKWYVGGKAVSEAISSTFQLKTAYVGKEIKVTVTGKATGYTTKAISASVSWPFAAQGVVSVEGDARVGQTLTAKTGAWSPAPSFKYQWLRDDSPISKATKASYKLTAADRGREITVQVTAAKSGYATVIVSSASVIPQS